MKSNQIVFNWSYTIQAWMHVLNVATNTVYKQVSLTVNIGGCVDYYVAYCKVSKRCT